MVVAAPEIDAAREAERTVLDLVLRQGEPLVIVDSPPGAGKTALVEEVVATGVLHARLRVAVVAPRREQIFDIARRLIANWRDMPIQMLLSQDTPLPDDLSATRRVHVAHRATDLTGGHGVVIATVAKMRVTAHDLVHAFDLLVCDEAYQVSYREVHQLALVSEQLLLVGDPGQLPPLVRIPDAARYEGARFKIHWPAPRELRRRFPAAPVVRLPLTRRLPPDSVEFVQPAFYPDLVFHSAAPTATRQMAVPIAGLGSVVDGALDRIAAGASMVVIALPPRPGPEDEVDDEIAQTVATVARRALDRAARWSGRTAAPELASRDIGIVDAHVRSGSAVRRELRARGLDDTLMVDTAEIWQGLQRPLMIVKHPLSGASRFDRFNLEPGRWCVMLSRHQVACVIVTRDGIGDALAAHPHDPTARASGAEDLEWIGWRAHRDLWDLLESRGRILRP